MPPSQRPTDAELSILRVLWELGPSTVRTVFERLSSERAIGYTTILKLLQIMHEKRLVVRDTSARSHIYAAAASEEDTQRHLVGDLLERAFGGSASKLVLQALESGRVSQQEQEEVRRILEKYAGEDE